MINQDVHISALIEELNGDLGGNVFVLLLAGQNVLDTIESAFIPAGGSALANLVTSFEETGTHTLKLDFVPVFEGMECNHASNTLEFTVEVVREELPLWTSSRYYHWDGYQESHWDSAYGESHYWLEGTMEHLWSWGYNHINTDTKGDVGSLIKLQIDVATDDGNISI